MEAFESFVAVALEAEGFVVSEAVVAARSDRLVLATVKSFFGSRGVVSDHVMGTTSNIRARKLYALLNDPLVRRTVIATAAKRYGYKATQVQLRLYVGRFAGPKHGTHEAAIRAWAAKQRAGSGPIQVLAVTEVVDQVREAASHKQYRDNAVLVTMKVLEGAGLLKLQLPEDIGPD